MQENNFEKLVQQKMEELKINPSTEVWQKVAFRIEKRKRDWKVFYLFSLVFIGIVTISVLWWKGPTADTAVSQSPANITAQEAQETSRSGKDIASVQEATQTKKLKKATADVFSTHSSPGGKNINAAKRLMSKDAYVGGNKLRYGTAQKTSMVVNVAEPDESAIVETGLQKDDGNTPVNPYLKDQSLPYPLPKIIGEVTAINTSGDSKFQPVAVIENKQMESFNAKGFMKEKHKWQFGLNLSMGVSTTRSGYLGIVGNGQSDENKAFSSAPPNTSTGNNTGSLAFTLSPVKMSKAFMVGLYVQKQVASKIAFTTGLNYKFYSTKMSIGYKVDSLYLQSNSSFYYRSGSTTEYSNLYHFIELPVGVLFKLSKAQQELPVYLYTGVSVSQLIKSTALQFSEFTGIYYRSDDVFNKTQVNLSTRLLFSLSKNQQRPLLLGPDFNYSLTKMADAGLYSNRHYSYFGIYLQKGIGSK